MNREAIEKFVAELESTDLRQVKESLCIEDTYTGTRGYCALGIGVLVAAEEMNVDEATRDLWLGLDGAEDGTDWPDSVAMFYGIESFHGIESFPGTSSIDPFIRTDQGNTSTSGANDRLGLSFWEIAQAYRVTYLKDES